MNENENCERKVKDESDEPKSELQVLESKVTILNTVTTDLTQKIVKLKGCLTKEPECGTDCDKKEPVNRIEKITDKINELVRTIEINVSNINKIEEIIK